MKILTAAQLRALDSRSGDTLALMETAGARVVSAIEERFEDLPNLKVLILCGKGNNGGDGLVVARLLRERGCKPQVATLTSDASVFEVHETPDLIVDALLGTGVTRPIEGLFKTVIESIPERFPE